ncbi:MAG: hypothetical protein GXP58_11650 [Deltaproteobacteria bacterium]|nr:hypothetical protein [Deltaproteobacteria bacterium]
MSVVVKKIGNRRYAYLASRKGGKVVHQYLGALSNRKVREKIEILKKKKEIPERFTYLFWDADVSKIELHRNACYIIEKVLEFGDLHALWWIQSIYPSCKIIEICEVSRKISGRSKNFWRIWFGTPS